MRTQTFALKKILPIVPSYLFVGIAYGILMSEAGFSPLWTLLSSVIVYAGSLQIIMVTLLTSGAPLYLVAVTSFFVNARHIFYGLGMIERFRGQKLRFPYMALTVTDETYSVLCSMGPCPEGVSPKDADFYVLLLSQLTWIAASVAGALLAGSLPVDLTGIDFSATAFFVTVCVDQWRKSSSHLPAITGAVSAVAFYFLLGPEDFLLPALSASLIVLLLLKDRALLQKRRDRA